MATLDPEFDRRLRALLTAGGEAGYNPQVASGYRSPEDQARAIDSVSRNVNGRPASFIEFSRGIPGYAAPVGASMHQRGQAADLTGNGVDWTRQNAADYGIRFPESLRGTDPNHAEIDPKFWGPVQDPRDRAATAAANDAPPLRVAEIPANKGGIGPNGTPNPPSVMPQVAGYQAREPMALGMSNAMGFQGGADPRMPQRPQDSGGGLLSGIAKFATNTFTNPLFQAGAAMVNAGSRGLNVGGGFMEGAQAAATASERQQAEAKRAKEAAAEQNRAMLWQDMVTNPNPIWAKDLEPGSIELAKVLGPEAGTNLILGLVQKNQVGQLDRMKLEETKRDHDIKARQAEAQYLEAQNVNADRAQTQDVIRRQKQQEMEAAQRRAEDDAKTFGTPPPPPMTAPAPPRQIQPLPQIQPRRMSDEVQPQDPMLIPTQAVTPGDAAPSVPVAPQKTIRIPYAGGTDVSPAEARAFGEKLLSRPEHRALGQDIIARADAMMQEKGGLSKPAQAEVDKTMVGDINHLVRLDGIRDKFNPRWLKAWDRSRMMLSGTAEYLGAELPKDVAKDLEDFTIFRRRTVANFNALLKEASGAAVTQQELERMELQEPKAQGSGLFGRPDSPTEFLAKLNDSRTLLIQSIARKNYMRNVLNLDDSAIEHARKIGRMPIELDSMKAEMQKFEKKTQLELRRSDPRMKDADVLRESAIQRQKVFGI